MHLKEGILNKNIIINDMTDTECLSILKNLLKGIKKATNCVPVEVQESKIGKDISLKATKGRGEFKIFYDGYADNQIVINLAHGLLRMEYNGGEILSQYCIHINKHDIDIMIKVFGILKDIQTLQDARNSKMFDVLQ
jgi:hypothetical protein